MPSLAQSQEQVYPQELALGSLYKGPMIEPEGPKLQQPFLQEHFMQDLLRMKEERGLLPGDAVVSHSRTSPAADCHTQVPQPWRRELPETAPASVTGVC